MNNIQNCKCDIEEKEKCLYNIRDWCNRYNIECKIPKISFFKKILNVMKKQVFAFIKI